MPPRGNRRGGSGNKRKQFNSKSSKFKPKRRKFNISRGGSESARGTKRKTEFRRYDADESRRPDERQAKNVYEADSSESEIEADDHMRQLLSTFEGVKSGVVAESSEDSDSADESDETGDNHEDNSSSVLESEVDEALTDSTKSPMKTKDSLIKNVDNLGNESGETLDEEDSDFSENENTNSAVIEGDNESSNGALKSDRKIEDENAISMESITKIGENVPTNKSDTRSKTENTTSNEEIEVDTQNTDDISTEDPFIKHTQYEMNESLLKSVQSVPKTETTTQDTWPVFGNLTIQIPDCVPETTQKTTFTISEDKIYAQGGVPPQRIDINKTTLTDLHVKVQIVDNVEKANKSYEASKESKLPLTPFQAELFSIMNNYQDLFYPHRTFENGEELRFAYCLHAVNHILKTRTKVIHHNSRLSKRGDVPEEFRDQGLVRPKILIIVPFRDAAYRIIKMLIDILLREDKGNVINKHRFVEEFTGGELIMPRKNPKPEDYELMFAGNSSDDFKIGITVTKKSLKLYADFYSSDIIIASPLGLRCIIGAEGEAERDFDFLASIELLILDQTEVFLMQNWDHLLHTLNHLHLQPKGSHGTDFSRVRTWSLNGWVKFYCQTLIFSSVILPEINSVFNKRCFNYAGRVRALNPVEMGTIGLVYVQLPHVYHKFEAHNVSHGIEARFNFFVTKILPQQKDPMMRQTLIYVPNYFDYVQLRNHLKKEDVGFVQICEYSKEAKVARARDIFFHGDVQFMLYTERYHFFNRKRIKGVRHLVFYQPPCFPQFYQEMCNLMQEANMNKKIGSATNMTVTVLYSKYDVQQLSAIVGTERALKMVSSDRNVHMLLTD